MPALLAALALAAAVWTPARAQAPGASGASMPGPAAAAPAAPRYSAAEIGQAFSYIDANRDGSISRDEAAGFKGVARNFDKADLDGDGLLSGDEFSNAMNKAK